MCTISSYVTDVNTSRTKTWSVWRQTYDYMMSDWEKNLRVTKTKRMIEAYEQHIILRITFRNYNQVTEIRSRLPAEIYKHNDLSIQPWALTKNRWDFFVTAFDLTQSTAGV